ncbi:MAG TPA: protein kinase [Pyrinomonadaceae bacterium]|nr:protein kinase [Pyrinomonadaceae bacterium]
MILTPNTRFGRYEIRSHIGAGGMGEVYLAQDVQLQRPVALKLLPASFANDENRRLRFEQEARAASALNHPNIFTVYEFGQADSVHYIATEFVEGVTLREHLRSTRMKLSQAVDIIVQVTSAIVAAHAAGIVHRDIKPENIMVRPDGIVKVLDFGIAKLVVTETVSIDPDAPTEALFKTEPGKRVGTVEYQSPEQSRGVAIDERTDIWSVGVVLYEMVTGRMPFHGETKTDVLVAILDRDPLALDHYIKDAPAELEFIIAKALRKDREHRYQTAKDLLSDLRSFQHGLSTSDTGRRSMLSDPGATLHTKTITNESTSRGSAVWTAHTTSHDSSWIKSNKVLLAILALLIAGGAIAAYRYYPVLFPNRPAISFTSMKVTRLSAANGEARIAVISPDGKYVAHSIEVGSQQSLWIGQTATSSDQQEIVTGADVRYVGLAFSPDGNFVYYVVKQRNNSIGLLYKVPVLGGTPTRLVTDIDSTVTFSPDGTQMAFLRGSSEGERSILIANADGTAERKLRTRSGNEFYVFGGPAWSPDGKKIACGAGTRNPAAMSVVEVDVNDGSERRITARNWVSTAQVAWLSDSSGLIVNAIDQSANAVLQLWYIPYPRGDAQRITNDLSSYNGVSMPKAANTIVSLQGERVASIWHASVDDQSTAKQLTSSKYDGLDGIAWLPDNKRIVYTSNVGGEESLWMIDAAGESPKQLNDRGSIYWWPTAPDDGRYVYFISDITPGNNIWRLELDGGGLKQLSTGSEGYAQASPDGRWIIYSSSASGKTTLWKMLSDGTKPEQLSDKSVIWPVVSPDGKMIAGNYREETKAPWKIALIPIDGGPPIKTFDIPPTVIFPVRLRWTPDGKMVAYHDTQNIWGLPIDGSQAKQLTNFTAGRIFTFDWSRDGRQLAYARGSVTSDIVTLSNFR